MPTTNLRKHTIPSGADKSFNRATIFEAFGNSIHDIVPVANTTERSQLVSSLNAKGLGPTVTNPLFVYRADAPGLHRIEHTTNGTVWLSGVLFFTSKEAADSFGAANGGLLAIGDEARVGGASYRWDGAGWSGWKNLTLQTGWLAVEGHTPRARMIDGVVHIEGAAKRAAGGNPTFIAKVPPELLHLQAGSKTVFLGASVATRLASGTFAYSEMYLSSTGVIGIQGYTSMDGNADWVLPLSACFVHDQR